ncbi:MAG: hypothetical protein AMS25_07240, partial [Gemmatimonas sp. SM23_52]
MRLGELTQTSKRVAATSARLEKIDLLAATLRRLSDREVPVAVAYLSGELPQGRIGIGPAMLEAAFP